MPDQDTEQTPSSTPATLPNHKPPALREDGKPKLTGKQFTNTFAFMPYSIKFAQCKIMLEDGHSYEQIRAKTGLSLPTIASVKRGEKEVDDRLIKTLRQGECDKLTVQTHRILDAISDEDIEQAKLGTKVTSAAILIDKRAIIEGKALPRSAHADYEDIYIIDKMREINERLAKLGPIYDAEIVPQTPATQPAERTEQAPESTQAQPTRSDSPGIQP